ncbi:MAG: chorismate mutase [Nanoarchaeota archaeon]|nr:chorismate mutase [Nanoarchaeota archaeon]
MDKYIEKCTNLEEFRQMLDTIDYKIVMLLEQREEIVERIAKYKKNTQISIIQKEREEYMMKKLEENSKESRLDKNFLRDIFTRIIEESKKKQEGVINDIS